MKKVITIRDITLVGLMAATLEAAKTALAFLPNIEIVSLLIIVFTLAFGWKTLYAVFIFVVLEGMHYSFGTWWIMYLYIWPMLCAITRALRNKKSPFLFSIVSALFGLFFGMICAIPYVVIGTASGGIRSGLYAGFTWWIAGIPWDIVHCVGNFITTLVLFKPLCEILERIKKSYGACE